MPELKHIGNNTYIDLLTITSIQAVDAAPTEEGLEYSFIPPRVLVITYTDQASHYAITYPTLHDARAKADELYWEVNQAVARNREEIKQSVEEMRQEVERQREANARIATLIEKWGIGREIT